MICTLNAGCIDEWRAREGPRRVGAIVGQFALGANSQGFVLVASELFLPTNNVFVIVIVKIRPPTPHGIVSSVVFDVDIVDADHKPIRPVTVEPL